jgi:hypothetical protein
MPPALPNREGTAIMKSMKKPPTEERLRRLDDIRKAWNSYLSLARSKSSPMERAYVEAGAEAWKRIDTSKRTMWLDWVQVAEALAIGEQQCAMVAGANEGGRYSRLYSAWLEMYGLDGIDAADRSRLKYYRQHASEIDFWRNALSEDRKRRTNHPRTVLRGYKAWLAQQQQPSPEPPNAQ